MLQVRNFSMLLCLCGCLAAQAEPQSCGTNLLWEMNGTTLQLTSPESAQDAVMSFDQGTAPWTGVASTITAIVMPNNLTTIAVSAFESCTALQAVTIPASVTTIYSYAFKNCSSLSSVVCKPTDPPALGTDVFAGCAASLQICVNDNLGTYRTALNWSTYSTQIVACSEPTDIDLLDANAAATRIIENNHVIIIRNNEKYTLTGQKL